MKSFNIPRSSLEHHARTFAYAAHAAVDQRRKYTNEPYINHPAAVAELVRQVDHTQEMLAAAWLHDTVEDTKVTLDDIKRVFGPEIMLLVFYLTDISGPEHGNRAARKALDRQHIADAGGGAKTVKLADLIDNTRTIVVGDPDFAKVYMREKRLLLPVLREGNHSLWNQANNIVTDYFLNTEGATT